MAEPYNLAQHIPPVIRPHVLKGELPLYHITAPDYDRLPLETFLIGTALGTLGRVPQEVSLLVAPHDPARYPARKRTCAGRLLYTCWANGEAVKLLKEPRMASYRHIILPDDLRWAQIYAFKAACDTIRATKNRPTEFEPRLLKQALGLDLPLDRPSIKG